MSASVGRCLAIDRDEINEILHFGLGIPRQASFTSDSPFYSEEWATADANSIRTEPTNCLMKLVWIGEQMVTENTQTDASWL